MAPQRFYRPELDVIRFLAFLMVFVDHSILGGQPTTFWGAIAALGSFGVPLFFTLSSYLITLLLLKERERSGTISLPKFYKRRALRIWPLYFLALTLSAMVSMKHGSLGANRVWYIAAILMVANFSTAHTSNALYLWSISVEEQFYVVWPGLMKFGTRRTLASVAAILIVIANAVLAYKGIVHQDSAYIWQNTFVQMEFFATGILLALFHEGRDLKPRSMGVRVVGMGAVASLLVIAAFSCKIHGGNWRAPDPWSMCTGYALVAIACAGTILIVQGISNWPNGLTYLGKISFGLYIYHVPFISLSQSLAPRAGVAGDAALALTLTVLVSIFSYRYFESPFLRLKEKYEVVKSRPIN